MNFLRIYTYIFCLTLAPHISFGQVNMTFAPVSWVPANAIVSKMVAADGKLYIATDLGLFVHEAGESRQLSTFYVDAFALQKEQIWLASGNLIMEVQSGQRLALPRQSKINQMELVGNALWIAADGGLFKAALSTGKVEELTERNSKFKRAQVNFVHRDKHNILWIGTSDGEYRIDGDKWKQYHRGIEVLDYFENQEGMWFVSADDMWLVDEYNRSYPVGLDEDLVAGKLRDFCLDKRGIMYLASEKLVRYDPYKTQITAYEDEVSQWSSATSSLLAYEQGIVAGTNGKGLYVLDADSTSEIRISIVQDVAVTCENLEGASFTAYVKGGQPPYVFRWDRGKFSDNQVSELGPGKLTLFVQDAADRRSEKSIMVADIVKPTVSLRQIVPAHKGLTDGGILLENGKGNAYTWSDGTEGPELKNKAAGSFEVTVSDASGCTSKANFTIPEADSEILIDLEGVSVGEVVRADNILFKADSTEVLESSLPVLQQIFEFLQNNPSVKLEVGGHTNTIPSHEYCDKLSEERAKNIAAFFYDRGVPKDRLSYKGYGKRQPLTQDTSLEGRRKNQRVEIKVLAR